MKQFTNVRGTMKDVPTLEVNIDTVYVRSNIERVETEDFAGWQYDEIQYDVKEYQSLLGQRTEMNEEYLIDVDFRLSMMELGL